ncbi:protein kinase domain-containing protein [Streptomyces sp. SBT349]|uniref:AbiJ-related protein n=1 Tax=Streptomyces sp. SBT349 TaxID=1580539 RepID=UPI000AE668E8|nr:hypothetical protein [Streptomyces sp. SBT349]
MGADEQDTGERVLAQAAALFSARGDIGSVTLLRAVHRLDFEQTDDGFVTETNWHDYYWAAVFYVEEVDSPAFPKEVLEHLLPTLTEVARQNQRPAVDRILVRPLLPEPARDWRQRLGAAPEATVDARRHRITDLTRRRIFDVLRLQNTDWAGDLNEVDFLQRLYDLDALPSNDPRFATAEGDIVQHRFNNDDWDNDWVFTDVRFFLSDGPDETFLRFLSEMIHPVVRSDGTEVERLLRIFNDALGRDGYALVPVDSISGYSLYAGRRIPISAMPAIPGLIQDTFKGEYGVSAVPISKDGSSPQAGAGYDTVRRRARGERKDYRLDPGPLTTGGQAEVFRAVHKTSQTVVAFKRRTSQMEIPTARMRREIDISRVLDGHPHYMPILDANAEEGWLIMPMAVATAAERHNELQDPQRLLDLARSLIDVLAVAHRHDWLHRDIKPQNILLLDNKWTLAD